MTSSGEPGGRRRSGRRVPATLALVYFVAGMLWIGITEAVLWLDPTRQDHVLGLQTLNGIAFVSITALVLYVLLRHWQRRDEAVMAALLESRREVERANATLEHNVAERTRMLEAANRELEAFVYAVSHDLRAPLRSLSGFSQILQESAADQLDERSLHYLKRITEASRRMSALIDDLLSLSRISRTELTPRSIDFSKLFLEAAAVVRERYPGHAVEFSVQPGMQVYGDARLLRIAVENLLDNAWKYTGSTAEPRVQVGIEDTPLGPAYFVRDNGAGFDATYADKLFAPFQRLHPDAQFPGTGIGLVTVQRILARHEGRIWADAAPGRGATFWFTIGEMPAAASGAAMREESTVQAGSSQDAS